MGKQFFQSFKTKDQSGLFQNDNTMRHTVFISIFLTQSFLFACSVKNTETDIDVEEIIKYSGCYNEVFDSFKDEIEDNKYTYLRGFNFNDTSIYEFHDTDLEAMDVRPRKETIEELTSFYTFTSTSKKAVYRIERDGKRILLFCGSPVGASGKYSDYHQWLLLDASSGSIIGYSLQSLSKYPFIFFLNSKGSIRLISYDYDRGDNGYIEVRQGLIPLYVELDSYELVSGEFIKSKKSGAKASFYCSDKNFYSDRVSEIFGKY
jgi:hypothetical protein